MRTGAVFGSLFGSFLSLLTGIGVLFIPFVGSIVAAKPIGAVLLGATSGAIAGSAGTVVSLLTTLEMPEDKAAIYQTRSQAGEFFIMGEVLSDRTGKFQLLLESSGGEEIHTIEKTFAHSCSRQCNSIEDLSFEVRAHLSNEAQSTFIERYNAVLNEKSDEFTAKQAA